MICEQNVIELKRIFYRKFPHKLTILDSFLAIALVTLELVSIPEEEEAAEQQIRDLNDRPILRAALVAKADILLTGDKDFLESGVTKPIIMTPSQFLAE